MKVFANATCGCCTITMNFKSEQSAHQAFKKAGLESSATITDDDGVEHEDVDTFYGFRIDEQEKRGLDYLVTQVMKKDNKD